MLKLIYFFTFIPLNMYLCRWLWNLILESAGTSNTEFKNYWKELNSSKKNKHLYRWLMSRSDNPKRTKKLYYIYGAMTAPSVICFNLAIINSFAKSFDHIVYYAGIIMPVITVILLILSIKNKTTK